MAQKKGYDVLRFIMHGNGSYISTTYVEGVTLFQWISEVPVMKKCDCIRMLHEIAKQLEFYHKSKGNPVYQYVNPYCIVLSEDKHVYLIDMKAESNGERLRKMQSRKIRERFLPDGDPYYQNAGIQTDLFGFGRTLQYMMAAVQLTLPLTRREEKQIKNVISRCLGKNKKKRFEDFDAVRKHLPQIKEAETDDRDHNAGKGRGKRFVWLLLVLLFVLAIIAGKDYIAKSMAEEAVSEALIMNKSTVETTTGNPADEITEETTEETTEEKSEETTEEITADVWNEEGNPEEAKEKELFEKLGRAQSFETLGRFLDAADLYEEILISLENVQEKERLYEKAATLYLMVGNYDKAYEVLEFGMSELLPSDYLWTCYLQLLTNNENITDEQKENYVEKFMENNPEYEKKEYQKLLSDTKFYQSSEKKEENMKEKEINIEKTKEKDQE